MLGVRLMYFRMLNVADTGMECRMPLRQSLIRLFLKNMFCFDVREFWNWPEYDSLIFSYHFSSPTALLRLNGATWLIVTVMFGNDTVSVEFCVRWDTLAVVDSDHFVPGKRYVMLIVELFVFSVKADE